MNCTDRLHRACRRTPRWWISLLGIVSLVCLTPLVAETLKGGRFSVTATTTGGGGRTASGAYAVNGSVGQVSTESSAGGSYQLTGGLLGIVVVPGDVVVTIEKTDDGLARLTWPASAVGFQLQFTGQLGAQPDWKAVDPAPTGNSFVTPMDQPLRFFRLHKP